MKKVLILSLSLVLVVGVGVLITKNVKAQTIVISDIKVDPTVNSAKFSWKTNISIEGQIEFWQTACSDNDCKQKSSVTSFNTTHGIEITLSPSNRNYTFHIIARDKEDNQVTSADQTFELVEWPTPVVKDFSVLGITDHEVALGWTIDTVVKNAPVENIIIEYGTTSGNYTLIAGPMSEPGWSKNTAIKNLFSNKTYYARLKAVPYYGDKSQFGYSKEISFTTLSASPTISKITPTEGTFGTEITIDGNNFGSTQGYVSIGRPVAYGIAQLCSISNADIISWKEDKVVVKVGQKLYGDSDWGSCDPRMGPVYIANVFYMGITYDVPLISIEGPTFTLTGEEAVNANIAQPTTNVNVAPTAKTITNKYSCNFSTTTQNETTIKVSQLFSEGSTTDNYLNDVYNAYKNIWGRYPRCSEMQFHLDHSTPVDRLQTWLNDNAVKNKYGCIFSTSVIDDTTIKTKSLFGTGSDTDFYLGNVYNAYKEIWGREPKCTELQFHFDHSTPIERLKAWLNENKPDTAVTPSVLPVLEKLEAAGVTKTISEDKTISFSDKDKITFSGKTAPNSIIIVTIESEPVVGTTVSDSDGNWSYTLDKTLEVGSHTIKVAVADKDLNKVSESDPVEFSIVSGAKTVIPASITEFVKDNTTTWLVGIVVVALIVIVIVYFIARKKPQIPPGPKK